MALQEEHGEQTQQRWLSRFSQERKSLSASVEEALNDDVALEEEEEWSEEVEEQKPSARVTRKTAIIPPRISLQSIIMPAVQPGDTSRVSAEAHATATSQAVDAELSPSLEAGLKQKAEGEQIAAQEAQNVSMLTRFAQRIASSLGMFGYSAQSQQTPVEEKDAGSQELKAVSSAAPTITKEIETIKDKFVTNITDYRVPSRPAKEASPPAPGRLRLAGHTAKIRLETAQIPATPKPTEQKKVEPRTEGPHEAARDERATSQHLPTPAMLQTLQQNNAAGSEQRAESQAESQFASDVGERQPFLSRVGRIEDEVRSEHMPAFSVAPQIERDTEERLPTPALLQQEERATSEHLPIVVETKDRGASPAPGSMVGSSIVEVGQCDVMVEDKRVTKASVVLVTLTSNPGPVVVQYVTLRPQEGFTVHLTAPATMRAPFNYVIFAGELV